MPGVTEAERSAHVEMENGASQPVMDEEKKKKKKVEGAEAGDVAPVASDAPKKKKKKRSSEESASGEDEAAAAQVKKSKKRKLENGSADADEVDVHALDNFPISDPVKQQLREKGIQALFPIQAQTFNIVFEGEDLVGRARTGQGKTLAFVLPIIESLAKSPGLLKNKKYGRAPSVLVLVPTRELAKQVHGDFEVYGSVVGLSSVCIYGGAQMGPQESSLRKGVDIVIGTPGRVKDFYERGSLDLRTLKFRVLDEADEMLRMGFVEDVELILGGVEDTSTVQTLLFSATMPGWVQEIASKFLKPSKKTVDLVGDSKIKASTSVKHLILPCSYVSRAQVVADVIKTYGRGGRVIVFTETKNDCAELAGALGNELGRALHGDIPQAQREVTLAGFRSSKFRVLIATDVAARGLDINDVELVIQCEPPKDVETYIHRSGRTGRAGNSGVAIMLFDWKKERMIPEIERKAGVKFERISPPQPQTIAKESAMVASKSVAEVSDGVVPLFREAAEELVKKCDLSTTDVLAKALAKLAGYTTVKTRSLQTSHDDATTLYFKASHQIRTAGYVFNSLRSIVDEERMVEIRRMNLTADYMGAIFDVPSQHAEKFTSGSEGQNFTIEVAEALPELLPKPERRSNDASFGGRSGTARGGRGGRAGAGGWSSRGGRGGSRGRGRW